MNSKELLDIYFKLTDRFDFLWNFYTFFIIALGSYFLSNKSDLVLASTDRIVLLTGYLLFVSMNVGALFITIKALQAVADAIYRVTETAPDEFTLICVLVRRSHSLYKVATIVVHSVMFCLIAGLVILW
ncbi:MAG: hypothetical protein BWK79_03545 [Beggiatoa sp. IS2]|nr:MAG: hypothetical protein BWK79_03545 [Beggiatoa sp. IS2]